MADISLNEAVKAFNEAQFEYQDTNMAARRLRTESLQADTRARNAREDLEAAEQTLRSAAMAEALIRHS
jgi:hypothetical protein